jgi:hypothetical protein
MLYSLVADAFALVHLERNPPPVFWVVGFTPWLGPCPASVISALEINDVNQLDYEKKIKVN